MQRNTYTEALILSSRTSGEDHRIVTSFSPELGVFDAMQFGGRKSKLRGMVQTFHSGTMYLYGDGAKALPKITDFDPKSYRPTLRESLRKNWAASLCLELVLKTHCAGDFQTGYTLVNAFLDGLNLIPEEDVRLALIRFLWRFLSLLGVQADTQFCARCNSPLTTAGIYIRTEGAFFCRDCSTPLETNQLETPITLCGESLNFLTTVATKPPKESRALTLSPVATQELENALFYLIEKAAECKLKTLQSRVGI